jgi:glyoxylate reductase
MRGIVQGNTMVRTGRFKHWDAFTLVGPEIDRGTLGIIGLGRIGSAVAERARGFGMRVLYFDLVRKDKLEEATGVEYVACSLLCTPDPPDPPPLPNYIRIGDAIRRGEPS